MKLKRNVIIALTVMLMIFNGITYFVIENLKHQNAVSEDLLKDSQMKVALLIEQRDELEQEIKDIEYRTSRTLHCSLSMVECNE